MICTIQKNNYNGFNMFVDGTLMWFCETRADVEEQIEHAKEHDFFDENTEIKYI